MATAEQNEAKRVEMKSLVAQAIERGWTRAELAKELRVSPAAIARFARGGSMGTNRLREMLAKLPAFALVAEARPLCECGDDHHGPAECPNREVA